MGNSFAAFNLVWSILCVSPMDEENRMGERELLEPNFSGPYRLQAPYIQERMTERTLATLFTHFCVLSTVCKPHRFEKQGYRQRESHTPFPFLL